MHSPRATSRQGKAKQPAWSGHQGAGRGEGQRQERAQSHCWLLPGLCAPVKSTLLRAEQSHIRVHSLAGSEQVRFEPPLALDALVQ